MANEIYMYFLAKQLFLALGQKSWFKVWYDKMSVLKLFIVKVDLFIKMLNIYIMFISFIFTNAIIKNEDNALL